MTKWYSVKDKLPKHKELVLATNDHGLICVVIFLESEQVFRQLMMQNIQVPHEKRIGYEFCSQEIPGHVLNNVTHWQYLTRPKS